MISEVVSDLKIGREDYHMNSCGSLGGGNHFIEIDKIDETTYVLFVHSGSRNLGKKVCEYFQKKATENYSGKDELKEEIEKLVSTLKTENRESEIAEKIKELKNTFVPKKSGFPKELAFVEDEMYEAYVRNMIKCQRIAKENRKLISNDIIKHLNITPEKQFDTIHNYIEQLEDGSIIIRKGAISAKKGELLSIPLNMKDGVIIGVGKGNEDWNNSAPHGAGRLLSRSEANNTLSLEEFIEQMKNINTWSVCEKTLDEAPMAYKSANEIVENVKETIDILCVAKPVFNFKAH
jgi:RNA-splicing ligase RtcB